MLLIFTRPLVTIVTPSQKTVISLDLQLYIKCIKLKSKEAINTNFIFRMGDLHIIFASLKVIGKYINCSGIDTYLVKAGICSPNTVQQFKYGSHMQWGIEAHTIIYLSFYNMMIVQSFEINLQLACTVDAP